MMAEPGTAADGDDLRPPQPPRAPNLPEGEPLRLPGNAPVGGSPDVGWGETLRRTPESFVAGANYARRSLQETAKLNPLSATYGEQPQPMEPDWRQEPYSSEDVAHVPSRWLPKAAYAMGQGLPQWGGAIAGGVPGAIIGSLGGAPGAIIGGGLGAGLGAGAMAFAQQVGPYYGEELQQSPQDPEAALTKAQKRAAADGVFSGLGAAFFRGVGPGSPFKKQFTHLALQVLGVQPAVGVAHQATRNVMEGEPATEGLGEAYKQGVAAALPITGAMEARRLPGHLAKSAIGQHVLSTLRPQPSITDVLTTYKNYENVGHDMYAAAEKDRYGNDDPVPNQQAINDLHGHIRAKIINDGANPNDPNHQEVFNRLDQILQPRHTGFSDLKDLQLVRHNLFDLSAHPKDFTPETGRYANLARHYIDSEALENPGWLRAQAGFPVEAANDKAIAHEAARETWTMGKQVQTLAGIDKEAAASDKPMAVYKNRFSEILDSDYAKKNFQQPVLDEMQKVINSKPGYFERLLHGLAPGKTPASVGLWMLAKALSAGSEHFVLASGLAREFATTAREAHEAGLGEQVGRTQASLGRDPLEKAVNVYWRQGDIMKAAELQSQIEQSKQLAPSARAQAEGVVRKEGRRWQQPPFIPIQPQQPPQQEERRKAQPVFLPPQQRGGSVQRAMAIARR